MKKLLSLSLAAGLTLTACMSASALEIKNFPEVPANYMEVVDPANPLKTIFSGAYSVSIPMEETERSAVVYLAEDFQQTQGFVMIVPATGTTPEQVLEEGGWQAVADANGLYLMVLDTTNAPADAAFLNAATTMADSRDYWRQPEGRNYIVAYGDNTDATLAFTESYIPNVWAGIATFGDVTMNAADIVNANVTELPVWMFTTELDDAEAEVAAQLAVYNGFEDDMTCLLDGTLVMSPKQNTNAMLLNDQPMSQVRISEVEDAAALNADRAAEVYSFLKKATREVGFGDKAIRYTHDLSDWGATVESVEIDGITRSWVQYVPTSIRETAEGKAPLMLALHGSALNGEYFAERTGFIRLAEEYGFIIVFPNGSINSGIAPQWNLNRVDDQWDDVGFLSAMIEKVCNEQPVDTSRIYCYGHSMGGMMTQNLISYLDGTFAAAAGTGCAFTAMTKRGECVETPIFVIMGEFDFFGRNIADQNAQDFINYYSNINHCDVEKGAAYRTGRFENYVYTNDAGAPMVRFTIADEMPHTATLDEGMMIFEFLSQYSRGEDGASVYGGGIYNAK